MYSFLDRVSVSYGEVEVQVDSLPLGTGTVGCGDPFCFPSSSYLLLLTPV